MNTYVTEPNRGGPMTYQQWLLWRIANPNVMCGPDVTDNRRVVAAPAAAEPLRRPGSAGPGG